METQTAPQPSEQDRHIRQTDWTDPTIPDRNLALLKSEIQAKQYRGEELTPTETEALIELREIEEKAAKAKGISDLPKKKFKW